MTIFVAKIERYDEGTNAFAFEAAHFEHAHKIANELVDSNYNETLVEVLTIEEFLNGDIYELCPC